MKNILIINSFKCQNGPFLSLFSDLNKDFNFSVWSADNYFLSNFKKISSSKLNKKIYLGPSLSGWLNFLFFLMLLPFFYGKYFFDLLLLFGSREKIDKIICLDVAEKIIFTPISLLLGLKVIWFEVPQFDCKKEAGFFLFFLKFISAKVKIITFTEHKKNDLISLGFCEENISNVYLGVFPDKHSRQENIFSSLAKAEKSPLFFKNFILGAVIDLNDSGRIEDILKTIKICSSIVSGLQLVIIGAGDKNKKFNWLVQKMEIEDRVWFVGEQENLKKWFDNFNIFISVAKHPTLVDLENILEAMSAGLPILAFAHKNLEDLVVSGKTGILTPPEASILAQKIAELNRDRKLVKELSNNAKKAVEDYFSRDRQLGEIRKIFNLKLTP